MRRFALPATLACLLILFSAWASPYLVAWQLQKAAERGDAAALSEHIDFPALRRHIQEQLSATMLPQAPAASDDEAPFSMLALGLAAAIANEMVRTLGTPEGIIALMQGKNGDAQASARPWEDAEYGYDSWNQFSVRVPVKQGEGEMRFVLRRHGLSWRLSEIVLPPTSIQG